MQTMPAKTRTLLVGGALLLLIASMGGLFYWSNYGTKEQPQEVGASLVDLGQNAAPGTGAAATQTPETANAAAPNSTTIPATYTVKAGDTLSAISRAVYGTDKYYGDIEALNEIEDADVLSAGVELKLPRMEDLLKAQAAATTETQATSETPATTESPATTETPATTDTPVMPDTSSEIGG